MPNFRAFYLLAAAFPSLVGGLSSAYGQNAIQLFGSTLVRLSTTGTSVTSPTVFNSATVNLSCPAGVPVKAILSSTPDGLGKVLVDNFIQVSVTTGSTTTTPVGVCLGGTQEQGRSGTQFNCFNSSYQGNAASLVGKNMDTYTTTGGVPAIDISALLAPGTQQATIGLVDTAFDLTNASLYLVTSCTQGGVTGPTTVTGNPIPTTNPKPEQLTQDFTFNPTSGQAVGFTYDLSTAQGNGTLNIANNTIPSTNDAPLDPALWQSQYAIGTSFATSSCLVHRGRATQRAVGLQVVHPYLPGGDGPKCCRSVLPCVATAR